MKLIDTHHHLWQLGAHIGYGWLERPQPNLFLGEYAAICNDFTVDSLRYLVPDTYQLLGTVHCEAECDRHDSWLEAQWIEAQGLVLGQIVWVDLLAPDASIQLDRVRDLAKVKGVRYKPIVAVDAQAPMPLGTCSLHDKAWHHALNLLEERNLIWDLRVPAWHLEDAAKLLDHHPSLRVVINHCGLPWDRSAAGLAQWRAGLRHMSQYNVYLKLSELGCPQREYSISDNQLLLNQALDIIGPKRCMFASNAPVSGLRVSYAQWLLMVEEAIELVCPEHREDVLWRNAVACYQLDFLQEF